MPPIQTLERLLEQRQEQVDFVDHLLSLTDADGGRDLVPAERANLDTARQRLAELDDQIEPLADYDRMRAAHADVASRVLSGRGGASDARPLGLGGAASQFVYRTAGEFLADYVAARDFAGHSGNPAAATRLAEAARQVAAIQNNITTDVPGLLPTPIVGPVVDTLDASRYFITSIGVKPLSAIAGTGFTRPKISQHTQVGEQAAEKTELPSRPLKVDPIPFTKGTYGGAVNISRQMIDWTSPAAWDLVVTDLAKIYGAQTDLVAAADFITAITQVEQAATDDLTGWARALYNAAVKAFLAGAPQGSIPNGSLPNHIWCSLDMWAAMGSIVDVARLLVPNSPGGNLGEGNGVTDFAGNLLNAPRTVVPTFPANTIVVGATDGYEFYEDQIGLLTAVEPKILGLEVAYGGYAAYGMIEQLQFCKVTAPPVVPLTRTPAKS